MTETAITVVGSINIDVSSTVNQLPRAGETVLASQVLQNLGGKGANQAVAAARAGGNVTMIARVGADAAGNEAIARLREEGITVDGILTSEALPTGRAFISVDNRGQNQIVVSPGANTALRPDDLDLLEDLIEPAGLLLTQGELDPLTVVRAAELAEQKHCRFVLNLAPVIDVPPSILQQSDPLILNELEAAAVGIDLANLEIHLSRSIGALAKSVVVTLGSAGAVAARKGVVARQPAPTVTPLDTTGAGDAFVGALVAALSRGTSLEEAAGEAVIAGAKSVEHHGANTRRS
ncbi:ribokinase [Amycolatopsis sp. GM8]|uniref:ribokinase n=1 Tax=Amycolatopsis sp. GM8 TaxID=2896530 RepID=UPI001F233C82|nr:ribokinase [Amycolatopsis sp. GM8]